MRDTILYDSALRLFGDHVSPHILAAAEAGEWPAALWRAVDEAGYLDVLADGRRHGRSGGDLRAAGHHAAPIPLPETMLGALAVRPRRDRRAGRTAVDGSGGTGRGRRYPACAWGARRGGARVVIGPRLGSWHAARAVRAGHQPRRRAARRPVAIDRRRPAPMPNAVPPIRCSVSARCWGGATVGAMEAALDLGTGTPTTGCSSAGQSANSRPSSSSGPARRRGRGSAGRGESAAIRSPMPALGRIRASPPQKSAPARPPARSPKSPTG